MKTDRVSKGREAAQSANTALSVRAFRPAILMLFVYVVLWIWWPNLATRSVKAFGFSLREVMMIMPGISILIGLFEVWVPKSMVETHMGSGSGLKGYVLAFIFGTAPTGPLYGAFPVAKGLFEKGASVGTVTVFLGAWGSAKIPQLMLEAKFMGMAFTVTRFALTAVGVGIMGMLANRLVKQGEIPGLAGAESQQK